MRRRGFLGLGLLAGCSPSGPAAAPIAVHVRVLFDRGAHGGKGLDEKEVALFRRYQERARAEFSASGLQFAVEEYQAHLRQQGYSEIPDQFLSAARINLFVTDVLAYDIDRHRTGGVSIGPYPRGTRYPGNRFYKTFLGLAHASEVTLLHEYAHHFAGDTRELPGPAGNFWSDLRNDFWLWRQRRGASMEGFRACAGLPWALAATEPRVERR